MMMAIAKLAASKTLVSSVKVSHRRRYNTKLNQATNGLLLIKEREFL